MQYLDHLMEKDLACLKKIIEYFQDFLVPSKKINQLQFFSKNNNKFCYVTDAITAMLLVVINGKNFVYNN